LSSRGDKLVPRTPDEALNWVRCIEATMHSTWRTPILNGAVTLAAMVDMRMAAEADAAARVLWAAVAQRTSVAQRVMARAEAEEQAARERRRLEFQVA
jgi:hypothetical protein